MALSITFLGHSGFLLDDGTYRIAVDPFLTGNPAAVHTPDQIFATHVALTHGHADHVGDTVAIARQNNATVVAAFEIANWAAEQGIDQTEPGNPGGRIDFPLGFIAFTQAFHSSSYQGRYMGMPCGLVIGIGDRVFYHAGDTGIFSDMALIGEMYRPDIAALPIGDRFTMGPEQASRAADLVGAPTVIPIHYRTFPPLVQSAENFRPTTAVVREMTSGDIWKVAS